MAKILNNFTPWGPPFWYHPTCRPIIVLLSRQSRYHLLPTLKEGRHTKSLYFTHTVCMRLFLLPYKLDLEHQYIPFYITLSKIPLLHVWSLQKHNQSQVHLTLTLERVRDLTRLCVPLILCQFLT